MIERRNAQIWDCGANKNARLITRRLCLAEPDVKLKITMTAVRALLSNLLRGSNPNDPIRLAGQHFFSVLISTDPLAGQAGVLLGRL